MSNEKNKKPGKAHEEKLENRVLARQLSRKLTEKELEQVSGGKMCSWNTDKRGFRALDFGPC